MFSRFFINRPIFAAVVALLITLAGAISAASLPIAQFPLITPPTVLVQAQYPGASAEVVASTVADPIEEQVNGVEGMLYMQSQSAADGSYALTVTFDTDIDVDIATVLVQNRVAIAMPRLPEEVQRLGVTTQKQSTQIVGAVNLISPDGRFDNLYLSNYATLQIVDELNRLPGVGYTIIFGEKDYSMRLWLDPQLLQARRLTADEVVAAVREQNVQVAAGQIGEPPVDPAIAFQYTVNTLGRLSTVEQFADIIVKTEPGGRLTRIKDVGKVELGALSYSSFADLDGEPTIGLGIFQLPEANALDVINLVRAKMAELEKSFPEGLEQKIVFDTTLFVTASIREVIITLSIAFVLVFIAVFIFLQDIRATLVPMITIPVALVGTFAVMAMLGFSINMLTLFGLVLAIGIVVDDAIVVVENTTRVMAETGKPRREATVQAMDEITGPIVGITLVLMAVFIPTAFLGGIPGQLYRQFALTIAASTFFSALNALTLSPALCAIFLHPEAGRRNFMARGFNAVFGAITRLYTGIVHIAIRLSPVTILIYLGLVGVTIWAFLKIPKGFMPEMDQGYMFVVTQLPESASLTRTAAVVSELEKIFEQTPGVANTITVGGYSALDGTRPPNMATTFLVYKPWDQRKSPDAQQAAIVESLREKVSQIEEALVFPFVPPAIRGLGTTGGFEFVLQDRGGVGLNFLGQLADEFVADGNAQSGLTGLFTSFRAGTPQLFVDIDRVKVKTLGIPLTSVFDTLQTQLGSTYVNDLTLFNHTFQVTAQAETNFRAEPDDIGVFHVRAPDGRMVPLDTLATVRRSLGPRVVSRYNMYPSATINGGPAAGYSSGQAIQLMDQMAESKMPTGFGYQWTSMAYQEIAAGQKAPLVFAIAVIFVLLVLAAQYESWLLPVAVVLAVPIALLGAVGAVFIRNMDVNIYTQIGIILLIALAAKNAILIVEFARDARTAGKGIVEAAVEGARLRLRPILMTSFAFILGVMPLVWATGAGASLRQSMGTAVFGGMIAGTFLAIFFIPVFYVLIQGLRELGMKNEKVAAPAAPAPRAEAAQ